ncbi:MAG: hypothetical protein ABJO01_10080 [Parasphingorhabdus sp.]|uniref:hypothetical protein n=1 Tax=Parasphingorhabdus sp. TaxID=2709688 RepID=UPI0032996E06
MAKPIKGRIEAALKPTSRVATISELIDELPNEIELLEQRRQQAESDSLNMALQEADQEDAILLEPKLARGVKRLEYALSQLQELRDERINSQKAQEQLERYNKAKDDREAVAKDLKEFWANEMPKLLDILQRMKENTEAIYRVNKDRPGESPPLDSAEWVARDLGQEGKRTGGNYYYIEKMRIPDWDYLSLCAWPPAQSVSGYR